MYWGYDDATKEQEWFRNERIFKAQARAAIKAMREPDERMVKAGNRAGFKANVHSVSCDVFTAMIDAALEDGK